MNKNQRTFIAAVIIGLLIYCFMPAANGLTELGVKLLAVFIPTIFLWLTLGGAAWASLLSVTMIVMLGVYDGNLAYQMQWGGTLVAMVIPFYMLAGALEETGALEYIVKWICSRKIVHGRPTLFTILFVISLVIVNVFISPMITIVMFFRILKEIAASMGVSRDEDFYRAHGLLIGWISQICDGCLIWGRPFILSMVAVVAGLGFEQFTITEYFKLSGLYLIGVLIVAVLIVKLWIRPDVTKFNNFDDAAIRKQLKESPLSKEAKISLAGMVVVLLCYVLASISVLGPVADALSVLPVAAPVTLVVDLLCVITVNGKPVMDFGKAATKLPWGTIAFLGSIMFYAGIFGREEYGVSVLLRNLLTPLVSNIPVTLALIAGLGLASIFTNVASNSVATIVVTASFIPAMLATGMDRAKVLAFGACVIAICATAICTISACGAMGVVYCDDGIEYKGTAKYSVLLCAIMVIFCTFVLIPVGTVLLGGCV